MSELQAKYTKALGIVDNPSLDCANGHFNSRYASLGECQRVVKDACASAGIAFHFDTFEEEGDEWVRTVIHDESESMAIAPVRVKGADNMQKLGSAITYAKRYSLCMAFAIVGEEDDDGNQAVQSPSKPRVRSQAPRSQQQQKQAPQDALAAARVQLAEAIDRWAQAHGADAQAVKAGIKKRPGYEQNKNVPAWYIEAAEEFLSDMDAAVVA